MCLTLFKVGSLAVAFISLLPLFIGAGPGQTGGRQSIEARLQVLEDREEIRQLLINYGRTLDRRDFAAFSRLFSENAEYGGGAGTTVKGPAAIARSLEETFRKNPTGVRSPNFHFFSNELIEVDGESAVAVSKGLFVVPNAANAPEIAMMATYEDVLTKGTSGWKFKRRTVRADIPYFQATK
jgi:hypothetical protein